MRERMSMLRNHLATTGDTEDTGFKPVQNGIFLRVLCVLRGGELNSATWSEALRYGSGGRVLVTLMVTTLLCALATPARAQQAAPLAQLQFDIIGVRLEVDPPVLTVP